MASHEMTIKNTILWGIIIFIFTFVVYSIISNLNSNVCDTNNNEYMINIPKVTDQEFKWTRTDSCKYYMDDTTSKILDATNMKKSDNQNAILYFPCGYNDIDAEIKTLPSVYHNVTPNGPVRVFIIDGADEITAKNYLWKNVHNHHGLNKALQMAPSTYLLTEPQKTIDMARLDKTHYSGKMYIMKKNTRSEE